MPKTRYGEDPVWADVVPLPQDDGGPKALATIAYTDEYREAMSYLRAVMAANEHSERVMQLTEHIIELNPAHYTVWLYRAATLSALQWDLIAELRYLNAVSLRHIKNYQIWQHRQHIVTSLGQLPPEEKDFLAQMLEKDGKNYHVWSYRQWLVRKFGLWTNASGEMDEVERLLKRDIRNNSAWHHRWFLVFGREDNDTELKVTEEDVEREVDFAKSAIRLTPQNESPWNYLRGVIRRSGRPISSIKDFGQEFVPSLEDSDVENVRSTFALDVLAEIYAQSGEDRQKALKALQLLESKFDPIRAGYWSWRRSLLEPIAS